VRGSVLKVFFEKGEMKMTTHINQREPVASPNINVTPLIDVLLVLLIIFMVFSPLKPSRFKALIPQLPDVRQPLVPRPDTLVVTINADRQLMLNSEADLGSVNDTNKLSAKLAQVFEARQKSGAYKFGVDSPSTSPQDRIEKTVFIKAPRSILYGEIAKVIDGVKLAGAAPIGLQIDVSPSKDKWS
jgi:biopolymer transport protein ExbD